MNILVFGCVLLLFGLYLKKFPPDYSKQRHIGYRTKSSVQNEDSWIKANHLAAKYLTFFGSLNAIIGLLILTFFFNIDVLTYLSIVLIPLTVVLLYVLVERQLP